jgi:hypothetical protein
LRTIHDALAEDAQSEVTIALKVALALDHAMRTDDIASRLGLTAATCSPPPGGWTARGRSSGRRRWVNALRGARPGARRPERGRFAGKRPSSRSVFYTEFDGRRSKRMIIKVIGE